MPTLEESFKTYNLLQRQQALERYYLNPNLCAYCSKVIKVSPEEKVSIVRQKKFCNASCAAFQTNKTHPRPSRKKQRYCKKCNVAILAKVHCSNCLDQIRRKGNPPFEQRTKSELFSSRKNWQSARSSIVHHAKKIYLKSGRPACCHICKYDKHFQIAHKRAVADFPDHALIGEINNIDNLFPLCPTHHWEQENGLIIL